jgi:hypothetical protein
VEETGRPGAGNYRREATLNATAARMANRNAGRKRVNCGGSRTRLWREYDLFTAETGFDNVNFDHMIIHYYSFAETRDRA